MALPKRRHSRARRDKRRASHKLARPNQVTCANCGQAKRPHRVCMSCGYYKGEEILMVKE